MVRPTDSKTILVADDQDFIRSLLVRMLRDLGYSTLEASDGKGAIDHLASHPQWVILDQQMEGFTGLEILQAIRSGQTDAAADTPVLMLTGHADKEIVRVAGELDVSALLTKPVSKTQLQERMKAFEKRPTAVKPPESYADVKMPVNAAEPTPPRSQGRGWIVKPQAGGKEAAFVGHGENAATGDAPRAGDVHYSRIRPGMILGKSLYNDSGQLMLSAGAELTADMVNRLVRRCKQDPALEFLTVVPQRKVNHPRP